MRPPIAPCRRQGAHQTAPGRRMPLPLPRPSGLGRPAWLALQLQQRGGGWLVVDSRAKMIRGSLRPVWEPQKTVCLLVITNNNDSGNIGLLLLRTIIAYNSPVL